MPKSMRIEKISHDDLQKIKPTQTELRTKRRMPIYALFENIRSMHNVGALFRTSDAVMVSEVFLVGATGQPPDTRIDKTALGATDVVPWTYCPVIDDAVDILRSKGVKLIALEQTHQSEHYAAYEYEFPVCLVVGNEVDGVSQKLLDRCDGAISIPMLGRASSLNVATAYGIALYEILRQYKNT